MSVTRPLSITGLYCSLLRGRRNEECKVGFSGQRLCRRGSVWEMLHPKSVLSLNHEVVLKKGNTAYDIYSEDLIDRKRLRGDLEPQGMQWQYPEPNAYLWNGRQLLGEDVVCLREK